MRVTAKSISEMVGVAGDLTLQGKIIRVFDKKSGIGDKSGPMFGKPWSFQGFVLEDETGQMTCTLKNRGDVFTKDYVGKALIVRSHHTEKGWFGISVKEEEYEGKKTVKAIITPSATLDWGTGTPPAPSVAPTTAIQEGTPQVEDPADMDTSGIVGNEPHVTQPHQESPPPKKDDKEALNQLREETIRISVYAWKQALIKELDPTHPAYKEIWSAMILAAGRNSDTLFISLNNK